MGRKRTLRNYLAGLLVFTVSLTVLLSIRAAAEICEGFPEQTVLYSDSGTLVENPATGTDLDNFSISIRYGSIEEDLGDTLLLRDAAVSVPVTVCIEYTGEQSYNAGDLTFTLQDIEGLTRRNGDDSPYTAAVITDIGAEKYGSGTGMGDWYYYSDEMENRSNSYVFCNKFEISGAFVSSIEMIWQITLASAARSGYTQVITSTLSVSGLGDRICRPIHFKNDTTPTVFEMKPFDWEPYAISDENRENENLLYGHSTDDYSLVRLRLDFDQTINSRIFGDSSLTSRHQEGSYAQVSVTGPQGVDIMNPDGSFNMPRRIESSPSCAPFLEGLIPEGEKASTSDWRQYLVFIPKALYPEGTFVSITAELSGRYYDDFEPFCTSTTQDIQVLPTQKPGDAPATDGPADTGSSLPVNDPPEKISVTATIIWDDENNQDNLRPGFVDIQLSADGVPVESPARLGQENEWTAVWNDLPKYAGSSPVSYSVQDTSAPGDYSSSVEGDAETGFRILRTHEPETISLHGSVEWDDNGNIDGMRPDSVAIHLNADGKPISSTTASAETRWTYRFENVAKNKNGSPVSYTVTEDPVSSLFQGNQVLLYQTRCEGQTITNALSPHMLRIIASVEWDDKQNKDGIRPSSISISLLKDGKKIQSETASATEDWQVTFSDVPMYADGEKIRYTIEADPAGGYLSPEITFGDITCAAGETGFLSTLPVRIINHLPEKQDITVNVSWDDERDHDKLRPDSITVRLYANKTEAAKCILTTTDGWCHTFSGLPKQDGESTIEYTIDEDEITGYEKTITGYEIVNTHVPEKTMANGSILWDDAGNQDALRPDKLTVRLFVNGMEKDTLEVSEKDGWNYSFGSFPSTQNGGKATYRVGIDGIDGYETTYDGFCITLRHEPESTENKGTVIWEDANDHAHLRPNAVTVRLFADENELTTSEVSASTGWKYSFPGLPRFKQGTAIRYKACIDQISGYRSMAAGSAIINIHHVDMPDKVSPDTISISRKKIRNDPDSVGLAHPASTVSGNQPSAAGSTQPSAADSTQPSAADGSFSSQTKQSPPTGDSSPTIFMMILLLFSLLLMASCVRNKHP